MLLLLRGEQLGPADPVEIGPYQVSRDPPVIDRVQGWLDILVEVHDVEDLARVLALLVVALLVVALLVVALLDEQRLSHYYSPPRACNSTSLVFMRMPAGA